MTVPRQSGKTTLFLSWQIDRSLNWGRPQRLVFTAQSGKDARDKWIDELFPLIRGSELAPLVKQINQGMGNESILWKTGSRIRLLSTSASSGHSKTLDQATLDEIWHDEDDRREQGLRPAMVTRPDAQLLVCSTAGTQASLVLNRKVAAGRAAVADDSGYGLAYFEWAAPEDWDPDDEDSWFGFMPALCPAPPCRCGEADGWRHTITIDAVRLEKQAMPPAEFRRAYGNRPTGRADYVIPLELWRGVVSGEAKPLGKVRFALDVAPDRSTAAVCGSDGKTVELIDHKPGTGWIVARCNQLTADHDTTIALDAGGPAGVFADLIPRVQALSGREVIEACASLYDAIVDQRIVFRADPAFDAAVEGVAQKQVGDRWVWSRKASAGDVTPLMAATLAFAAKPGAGPPTFISMKRE